VVRNFALHIGGPCLSSSCVAWQVSNGFPQSLQGASWITS